MYPCYLLEGFSDIIGNSLGILWGHPFYLYMYNIIVSSTVSLFLRISLFGLHMDLLSSNDDCFFFIGYMIDFSMRKVIEVGQKYQRKGMQKIQIAVGGSEIEGFIYFSYFGHVDQVELGEGEDHPTPTNRSKPYLKPLS